MEDQAAESEATLPAESSPEQEQQEAQPAGEPADVKDTAKDEEVTEQVTEEVPPNEDSVEPQTEVKEEEQSAEVATTPKPDDSEEVTPEQETQGEEVTKADEESEDKEPATESGEAEDEEQKAPDVLPTSESFTEGEAPETGPVVADALSRGQTPPAEEELLLGDEDDRPQPGTPERAESEELEPEALLDMEQEFEVPVYNREELLQKYQEALHTREQLNQQNYALQHKLADYFRKKKTDEARQEVDKNVADQDQRYMKYMSNLEELRQQESNERELYTSQLEEMKERKAEKQTRVEEEWTKSIEFKNAVAAAAINSRSGRPIPAKDIEMYEANERRKEAEVSQVRLENIKLKNRLRKQEMQLKQKEELAEGLHLIDFEQLKIENQTYNEKIEERNEELLKLRKKITSTVQVLTHLKEKLQFVQAENQVRKQQLAEVEQEVAQKRDILSRTKQARDALRHDNNKLQQKCGLLGNSDLLRDFEVSTDEVDDLYQRLDILKRSHAALTLTLNGVKKKIELAKENKV